MIFIFGSTVHVSVICAIPKDYWGRTCTWRTDQRFKRRFAGFPRRSSMSGCFASNGRWTSAWRRLSCHSTSGLHQSKYACNPLSTLSTSHPIESLLSIAHFCLLPLLFTSHCLTILYNHPPLLPSLPSPCTTSVTPRLPYYAAILHLFHPRVCGVGELVYCV